MLNKNKKLMPFDTVDHIEEKYGVTHEALKKCIAENWKKELSYAIVQSKVRALLPSCDNFWWNGKDGARAEIERKDYFDWYFSFDKKGLWADIRDGFICWFGKKHTLKEAATIAAEFWLDAIFNDTKQDNGDSNWHSVVACYFASNLKKSAIKDNLTPVVYNNVKDELIKFYTISSSKRLYSDYEPDSNLYDILVNAGIDKKDAFDITPFKTGCNIDPYDNSVEIVHTYGQNEYR